MIVRALSKALNKSVVARGVGLLVCFAFATMLCSCGARQIGYVNYRAVRGDDTLALKPAYYPRGIKVNAGPVKLWLQTRR